MLRRCFVMFRRCFVARPTGNPRRMNNDQTATDTPVVEVLREFAADGWTTNFVAAAGAAFRCTSCTSISPVVDSDIGAMHRVEGASDPSDMQLVVGMTCPVCLTSGVVVLGYGPAASELDQQFLAALDDSVAIDPVANRIAADESST